MKHIYFFLLVAVVMISNPVNGQDFTNVKVNHITAGKQNTDVGNSIAVYGNNVYLLWAHWSALFSYVSKSTNGGITFNDGVKVGGNEPQIFGAITTDNSGSVYVVWNSITGENLDGVYFSKSTDEATTFSTPLTISAEGRFTQINVHGSNVYVLFIKPKPDSKIGYFFARSTNGGSTFEVPYEITDVPLTSADIKWDSPYAMSVDNSGNIYCVWNDGRRVGTGTDIYLAKSTNNGVSFSTNIMVNDIAGDPNKIRTAPKIAAAGSNVYVAWKQEDDAQGNNRKILFGKSTNGGSSFGATSEREIASGGWGSPSLAINSTGEIYIAYPNVVGTKNGLFCTKSNDQGSSFPVTVFLSDTNLDVGSPSISVDGNDILYAVWTCKGDNNEEDVYFAKGKVQTATAPAVGNGTSDNPYQIATLENLCWIVSTDAVVPSPTRAERWSRHYIQTANIDASVTWTWNSGEGWARIGIFTSLPFTGSYDGQNYKITGLYINRPNISGSGLFGYITNATIKNLGLESVNITALNSVGALVGWKDYSLVKNCYSTGSVTGQHNIGGLIGGAYGTGGGTFIKTSYSTCSVSGSGNNIGGLVGNNYSTCFIDSCYSTGSVSGLGNPVGGLVGGNNHSTIEKSYSTSSVTGTSFTGGLVGSNIGIIRYCYSTGSVTGTNIVGGLVGNSDSASTIFMCYSNSFVSGSGDFSVGGLVGQNNSVSIINYCYSSGQVTGNGNVGGFVGTNNNKSTIELCYSTGSVSGTNIVGGFVGINANNSQVRNSYSRGNVTRTSGENTVFGGFVGNNTHGNEYVTVKNSYSTGSVFYSGSTNPNDKGFAGTDAFPIPNYWQNFWDNQASNQPTGIGAMGKTTAQMKTNTTFLSANWADYYWNIGDEINNGYPYLKWQNPGGSSLPVVEINIGAPKYFSLEQNYPNPFNPNTVISYRLSVVSDVTLKVYDLLGREIATLVNEQKSAGIHSVTFNASNLPSGIYIYRLQAGKYTESKKMILMK